MRDHIFFLLCAINDAKYPMSFTVFLGDGEVVRCTRVEHIDVKPPPRNVVVVDTDGAYRFFELKDITEVRVW